MQEHTIQLNGQSISYFDNESGDVTLLFIHGSFINKEYWLASCNYFSQKFRTIAIDLPGHGKSAAGGDETTIKAFGKMVDAFVEQIQLNNVIIIGHSIGANVMLEMQALQPNRYAGLIAVDYFKNVDDSFPKEQIDALLDSMQKDFAKSSKEYASQVLLTPQTPGAVSKRVVENYSGIDKRVGIALNNDFFHYGEREKELLQNLHQKLHIINVNFKPTNLKALKKYLHHAYDLAEIDGTSHFPMIENPVEFNEALRLHVNEIVETVLETTNR